MKQRRVDLRTVDVEAVLNRLGMEVKRRDGNELYCLCPNPSHQDRHPSWHIHSRAGDKMNSVFHCWSCKWSGNIITLVSVALGISLREAAEEVSKYAGGRAVGVPTREADLLRGLDYYEPQDLGGYFWRGERIQTRSISSGTSAAEYLAGRLIGPEWITKCELLDWPEYRRILIPIYLNGKLISWVARSYVGGKPKTLAPEGAPKSWELIGIDEVDTRVPVVNLSEGWADRIRLLQIRSVNPLALCGSRLTEHQVEMLLWAKIVVIWLDGDKAGTMLASDTVSWLGLGRRILVVPLPSGTDPNYFSPPELAKFQPVPWNDYRR